MINENNKSKILAGITIGWVALMLLSLIFGFFNPFFWYEGQQGIDYWALPRGFLNLTQGHSLFDTFNASQYGGPRTTWYLAHPAFEVLVAPWFSFFGPWTSYTLFQLLTIATMAYTGYLFAKQTDNAWNKQLCYFLVLFGFPVYWLLYVGNMHAPLILAVGLLLIAFYEMAYLGKEKEGLQKFFIALLISFLTKPIVLIMLPLFLCIKETRMTTIKAGVIYGVISLLFIVIPFLNPESIGLGRVIELLMDPAYVKQHMNIYQNQYALTPEMKDNSIHWLNLIAQSDYYWNHIQIFSLSAFSNTLFGTNLPATLYKLPLLFSVLLSFGVFLLNDSKKRLEFGMWLTAALSLTFFLSYNTVWEYQFTSALPLLALLVILKDKNSFVKKNFAGLTIIGLLLALPTPYIFYGNPGAVQDSFDLNIIRINRTLPVLALFGIFWWQAVELLLPKTAK